MMPAKGDSLLRQLRRTLRAGVLEGAPDEELLERFVAERDEAAFAVLVRRHGPMVWSVCQRVLAHRQDAEDAFQAAFLVLACKASAISRRKLLANWLFGVARRAALNVRAMRTRRARHERLCSEPPEVGVLLDTHQADLRAILDDELARMPEKYRLPLLMCGLEGMTHAEAGKYLGWPIGTVAGRLSRGREMLRARLLRRGIAAPALAASALFVANPASATVPPLLVASSVRQGLTVLLCGKSALVAGTQTAATLARALLFQFCLARVWTTAAALAFLVTSLGSVGVLWHWSSRTAPLLVAMPGPTWLPAAEAPRTTALAPGAPTHPHEADASDSLLPADPQAVVLRMERSVDLSAEAALALRIHADGRFVAELPEGLDSVLPADLTLYAKHQRRTSPLGYAPSAWPKKTVEGQLSSSELEELLHFAIVEQEFFSFDPGTVRAAIREKYRCDGSVFDAADATTTRFGIQTASQHQEVQWTQLTKAAWDFSQIEQLHQLQALDHRLSQVFSVMLAGGPERVEAVVAKMNDLARSYYARHPDVPPLTAADLTKVTPSPDRSRMTFTFARQRDQLVRDPLLEVSIDVPEQGEPTLCYVMSPALTFATASCLNEAWLSMASAGCHL